MALGCVSIHQTLSDGRNHCLCADEGCQYRVYATPNAKPIRRHSTVGLDYCIVEFSIEKYVKSDLGYSHRATQRGADKAEALVHCMNTMYFFSTLTYVLLVVYYSSTSTWYYYRSSVQLNSFKTLKSVTSQNSLLSVRVRNLEMLAIAFYLYTCRTVEYSNVYYEV
jgi:hypothetical protein